MHVKTNIDLKKKKKKMTKQLRVEWDFDIFLMPRVIWVIADGQNVPRENRVLNTRLSINQRSISI